MVKLVVQLVQLVLNHQAKASGFASPEPSLDTSWQASLPARAISSDTFVTWLSLVLRRALVQAGFSAGGLVQ